MKKPTTIITATNGSIRQEQVVDQVGFVADLVLVDDARTTGVILAVACDALILEIWDPTIPGPNGDLSTVALSRVTQICIG